MGKFKVKEKRHTLRVQYELAPFEEMIAVERSDVENLEKESERKWTKQYDNHRLLCRVLQSGVTYNTFLAYLQQITALFMILQKDYFNSDELVQSLEQFIIDEHTQKIKLIYIKSIGMTNNLTFQNLITALVQTTNFVYEEALEMKMSQLVKIEHLEQMEHILEKNSYYLIHLKTKEQYNLTFGEHTIGFKQFRSPAISREHLIVWVDNERMYIQDKHSLNGTFLNGERLLPDKKYVMRAFDTVQLADNELICMPLESEGGNNAINLSYQFDQPMPDWL